MGLEQRAEPSLGEQSRRPVIKPPPRRLPWFEGGLVGVLGFVGAHGMLPDRVFAQSLPQSIENTRLVAAENPTINPLTLELSSRVTHEIVKLLVDLGFDIDVTGELLTNAWVDDNGDRNILYRNIWFRAGMDGKLTAVNTLDRLNKQGLDDKLDFGLLGDPIPPKQDTVIEVGTEIKEFLQSLKQVLDIGPVVGYRNYGPFEVYRTPNAALMRILEGPQANTLQLTNTGYQALVAGLIPQEYALSPLPFATGGGTTPTSAEPQQQPEQVIEGPRKILTVYHQPEAPLEVVPTPTFNQLEEHLFSQGVNRLEIKYNSFPELPLPGNGISWMSICPTNNEPTCETPFIYLKHQVDPTIKAVYVELKLAGAVPNLSTKDIDYLNRAFQGVVADRISIMKYENRMAMIPDAKLKLEAETTLLQPITEIKGLQFIFK